MKEKFNELAKVLPSYDPLKPLCHVNILEEARKVIEELQEDLEKILTENKDKVDNVKGTILILASDQMYLFINTVLLNQFSQTSTMIQFIRHNQFMFVPNCYPVISTKNCEKKAKVEVDSFFLKMLKMFEIILHYLI